MIRALLVSLVACAALGVGCASTPAAPTESQAQAYTGEKLQEAAALGKEVAKVKLPVPPSTRAEVIEETLHGQKISDPYRWLEQEKAPEVQQWMKAQDDFARAQLHQMPGRDALMKRYTELLYFDSISPPAKRAGRYFYSRTHKDKEKGIVYWKQGEKGAEKVLIDPNGWSTDGTVSLGGWNPSWDGKKVVYQKKPNAADEATLYVLDVDTGKVSEIDVIEGGKYASPSWTPDGKGFYYVWLPTDPSIPVSERPGYAEARFHKLGTDPKTDLKIRERTGDPTTFQGIYLSRDGKYLFSTVDHGWNSNDVYVQRLGKDKTFKPLVLSKDARYAVDVWRDAFYVSTDEGAPNKRVFKVDPAKLDRKDWKELVPEDKTATLQSSTIVGGHLALEYMHKAASELRIHSLDGKLVRKIELPGIGTASNLAGLEDDDETYYAFSSFTQPRQVFKASVKSGKSELWAKIEVPVDPSPYTVEQVWYPSKDGTQISMFLVHRKDLKRDGSNPTLLYGYGGFDVSITSAFSSFIYPWLEAGGVYATANLRGGGEYGKAWHDAGKGAHKQNVFDDFIGAAEYLVREKYTSPEKLAVRGGSNGGLLVSAVMVQRPDLFKSVICAVPLIDMVRYHLYGSGKTWISEYGSAENPDDFKHIFPYSPYSHVKRGTSYPALLMMSADHDDRVDPMHARKFTAAVQNAGPANGPQLLRIEMNAGHGGADQVRRNIESSADQIAFLFETLKAGPAADPGKPTASAR
jgi:prolyl oligopeptidase